MDQRALCPVRETLKVCLVCGQIFDIDHPSEALHHRHSDGGEMPLRPDRRPECARPSSLSVRAACGRLRARHGPLPIACERCATLPSTPELLRRERILDLLVS
jgi:hypothetical protein